MIGTIPLSWTAPPAGTRQDRRAEDVRTDALGLLLLEEAACVARALALRFPGLELVDITSAFYEAQPAELLADLRLIQNVHFDGDGIPVFTAVLRSATESVMVADAAVCVWEVQRLAEIARWQSTYTRFLDECLRSGVVTFVAAASGASLRADDEDVWTRVLAHLRSGVFHLVLLAPDLPDGFGERLTKVLSSCGLSFSDLQPAEIHPASFTPSARATAVLSLLEIDPLNIHAGRVPVRVEGDTAESRERKLHAHLPVERWDEESLLDEVLCTILRGMTGGGDEETARQQPQYVYPLLILETIRAEGMTCAWGRRGGVSCFSVLSEPPGGKRACLTATTDTLVLHPRCGEDGRVLSAAHTEAQPFLKLLGVDQRTDPFEASWTLTGWPDPDTETTRAAFRDVIRIVLRYSRT